MRAFCSVAFAILGVWPLATPLCAASLRVPDDYETIQAAVDAAHEGDTIELSALSYTENVIVDGKSLSFRGVAEGGKSRVSTASQTVPTFKVRGAARTSLAHLELYWVETGTAPDIDVPALDISGGQLSMLDCRVNRRSGSRWGMKAMSMQSVEVLETVTVGKGLFVLDCPSVFLEDVSTEYFDPYDGRAWVEGSTIALVRGGDFSGTFVNCSEVQVEQARLAQAHDQPYRSGLSCPRATMCPQDFFGDFFNVVSGSQFATQPIDPGLYTDTSDLTFVSCQEVRLSGIETPLYYHLDPVFGGTIRAFDVSKFVGEDIRINYGRTGMPGLFLSRCPDATVRRSRIVGWTGDCAEKYAYCVHWIQAPFNIQICDEYEWEYHENSSGQPGIILDGAVNLNLVDSEVRGGSGGPFVLVGKPDLPNQLIKPITGANAITRIGANGNVVQSTRSKLVGGFVNRPTSVNDVVLDSRSVPAVAPGITVTTLPGGLPDNTLGWVVY